MSITARLEFSTNWNGKLHCRIFHTLRRSARFELGEVVEVYLQGNLLGSAMCIGKHLYADTKSIPEPICYLDTGYNRAETENILSTMYKVDPAGMPIYGYLFKWNDSATTHRKELKRVVAHQTELALT